MIRVLLERRVAEGLEAAFDQVLRDVRQGAVHFPGYISGESLRDPANPHHFFVISTWRSKRDWDAWEHSEERERFQVRMTPLLEERERVTVLEPL